MLLRWVLLLQVGAVALIAWLAHGAGAGWPLAVAAAVGVLLLVRVLITANNFVLTRRFPAPPRPNSRSGRAGGSPCSPKNSWPRCCSRPGSWRATPRQRLYADAPCAPLLLLHGYGCNSGYWAQLTPRLDALHISHASLDLEPIMGAIDDYVPMVQAAVASLCAQTGRAA
ncbi:hypothetical protein LP420_05455 [Massilia sp. B-10]|nr:hypothetical protein LP420_05455 [Massilia sp. B-10]